MTDCEQPHDHPRLVELCGQVTECRRGDVSKRSDRSRWILRLRLRVSRWRWNGDPDNAVDAPHPEITLVAPETRWIRMLDRSPQAGDRLRILAEYAGETTMSPRSAFIEAESLNQLEPG